MDGRSESGIANHVFFKTLQAYDSKHTPAEHDLSTVVCLTLSQVYVKDKNNDTPCVKYIQASHGMIVYKLLRRGSAPAPRAPHA